MASGSGALSRTVSASWIADSAASVGSFIFFGVFAMSVVASYYAGPEQRPARGPTAPRARSVLRSPPDPPRAAVGTRRKDIPLPPGHPIGLAYRRKLLVKVSLIIVNAVLTMGGRAPRARTGAKFFAPDRNLSGHIAAAMRPSQP